MSTTQVQLWYNRFNNGRKDVNDDARPGRSSTTSTTDENIEALDNLRITIRKVADDVDILFSSCQAIFTDVLGMKRAAAKIVPKLLNFEQKQHRSRDVDDVHRRSRFAQKGHNC